MRRFYAVKLPTPGELVTLDDLTSHHLLRVTGVAPGELVELFDGQGQAVTAMLVGPTGGRAVLKGAGQPQARPRRPERVLLVGLPKKPAWELTLRMVTELGATELRPFIARRSVATGDHTDRWERIVHEAARQCGRADWPRLTPLRPLTAQLEGLPEGDRYALSPGGPLLAPAAGDLALLSGPEGGLTGPELELAEAQGFVLAGLGPLTLRADTAPVAALARYGLGSQAPQV